MRTLILNRQAFGSYHSFASTLEARLPRLGIQGDVRECSTWMPAETGGIVDRKVSKALRAMASDYDVVHAMGYRAAWACAEAFGEREAWVYSAHDLPRTIRPEFIERLGRAAEGLSASEEIRAALKAAGIEHVRTVSPAPTIAQGSQISRAEAKALLGMPDFPLIVAMGRFTPERALHLVAEAMPEVWIRSPGAALYLSGDGPDQARIESIVANLDHSGRVRLAPPTSKPLETLAAADVVVVPNLRAGFSLLALEAMALGTPVVFRDLFAFREIADPGVSGWFFEDESEMPETILAAAEPSLTTDAMVRAAKTQVAEHFDLDDSLRAIAELYRSVVS